MFDHLDDPARFVPDDDFRQGVYRKGRRIRLAHRAAKVAGGLAATLALVGLAGNLYVDRRDSAIDRVDIASPPSVDGAINILLIGTDQASEGRDGVEGARADTMVVVRLDPEGSIGLLSLPRDLWTSGGQRLDTQREESAQALITAVTETTGVPVDHYIEVDMAGLVALVDEAGGLPLTVEQPLVDQSAGLHLEPGHCADLDGETVLALLRARHIDGDVTSEIGRMGRGRSVLSATLFELSRASGDVERIDRVTRILADHATLDDGLTLDRLADVAGELALRYQDTGTVDSPDLPVADLMLDEGAYLGLVPASLQVLQRFGTPADFQIPELPEGGGSEGSGQPVTVPGGSPALAPCEQMAG